jgi:hypothetical protein
MSAVTAKMGREEGNATLHFGTVGRKDVLNHLNGRTKSRIRINFLKAGNGTWSAIIRTGRKTNRTTSSPNADTSGPEMIEH